MAILRPLAVLAAIEFREAVDLLIETASEGIPDLFCFPAKLMPQPEPVFVPCREGRSLYSPVKRRSISKRNHAGRLAGVNHGKNVTFYED